MNSLTELIYGTDHPKPDYELYCDMDGCLTNFEKRFVEELRREGPKYYSKEVIDKVTRPKHFEALEGPDEFWKFVDQYIGLEFWTGMDWMPQGQKLWEFIKNYKPKILSSPSRHESSRLGKKVWVRNHLEPLPEVIFRFGNSKADFASPNSILIDDRPSIIQAWKDKGGIAVECKDGNTAQVIEKLKELGYE